MFASLRYKFSNYRTCSLRFDIEKNIDKGPMPNRFMQKRRKTGSLPCPFYIEGVRFAS
jgi:hypothetical protein